MDILKNSKAVLFDLDGTLYVDDVLIDGATEILTRLRKEGKKIVFLTNNSSKTPKEYYEKLNRLGLFFKGDLIYSSLDAAKDYISDNFPDSSVYAMAGEKVKKYLIEGGIRVVSAKKADLLLLTFDRTLNYKKMTEVNDLLIKGTKCIATHPDAVCPANPFSVPDLGAFIEMFKVSSGRVPDIIVGKPYGIMAEYVCEKLSLTPRDITMVGDRLSTDIAFGKNGGFNTVLVFSGETTEKIYEKSDIKADFAINSVKDL